MKGKTVIVTGSNTGIGRVTALELARQGAEVIMACRSEAKTVPVVQEIRQQTGNDRVEFMKLDLASFADIEDFATRFLATGKPLHVLVNNAGLAGQKGLTTDGFEMHWGVNHLGPMLLTLLLLDRAKQTAEAEGHARLVHVASRAHTRVKGVDYTTLRQPTQTVSGFPEYCVSKLGNVLFNQHLAGQLQDTGLNTYALHPGVVASDIWRRVPALVRPLFTAFMISNEDGAKTSIHCATSRDCAQDNGLYYDKSKPKQPARHVTPAAAQECWERSMEHLGR